MFRYETLSMDSLQNKANGSIITLADLLAISTEFYWGCYYDQNDGTFYGLEIDERDAVGRIVNGGIRWEYENFGLIVSDSIEWLKINGDKYYTSEEDIEGNGGTSTEYVLALPENISHKTGEWVLVTYHQSAYRSQIPPKIQTSSQQNNFTIPLQGVKWVSLLDFNTNAKFNLMMTSGNSSQFVGFSMKRVGIGSLGNLISYCQMNSCVLVSGRDDIQLNSLDVCGKTFVAKDGIITINSQTWAFNGSKTISVNWYYKADQNMQTIDLYQYQMDTKNLIGDNSALEIRNKYEHSANCAIPNYLINNKSFIMKTYTDPIYMKDLSDSGFHYNYNLTFPTTSRYINTSAPKWWYGIPKNWPPHVFFENFLNENLAYKQNIIAVEWTKNTKQLRLTTIDGDSSQLNLVNATFPIYIAIRKPVDPTIDVKQGFNIMRMTHQYENSIQFGNDVGRVQVNINANSELVIYVIDQETEDFYAHTENLSTVLKQIPYIYLPDLITRHANMKKVYNEPTQYDDTHIKDSTDSPLPSTIVTCSCNIKEINFDWIGYVDALWFEDEYYNQKGSDWFIVEEGTFANNMFYLATAGSQLCVDHLWHTFMHPKYNGILKTTFFTLGNLFSRPMDSEKLNSSFPATIKEAIVINETTIAQNKKDYNGYSFEFEYIPGTSYGAKIYFPPMFQALAYRINSSISQGRYQFYKLFFNRAQDTQHQSWFFDAGNPVQGFSPDSFWTRNKTGGGIYWTPNIFLFPYVIINGSSEVDIETYKQFIADSTDPGRYTNFYRENLENNLQTILEWVETKQPNRIAVFASLSDTVE